MTDLDPQHLIGQWRAAMESVVDRERRLQQDMLSRAFAPLDAVFDLLEESAAALGAQADALEASARALEHAAELMRVQSDLSARAIATLRGPSRLVKRVGGIESEEQP